MRIQGILQLQDLDVGTVTREAADSGFKVFVMPSGIDSRESFFNAVRKTFPMDPPLIGSRSWDALSDSLWGGLYSLDKDRILIVWPNAKPMSELSPGEYDIALSVLKDVITSLSDPEMAREHPKSISVIVGQG